MCLLHPLNGSFLLFYRGLEGSIIPAELFQKIILEYGSCLQSFDLRDILLGLFDGFQLDRKTYGAIFLRRLQSEKALIFHPFHDTSNALSVYSGALGGVARTTDYNSTKTLLTFMHTPAADIVVLASPVCIKVECPFEFPLLAPAHRSCSGFRSL